MLRWVKTYKEYYFCSFEARWVRKDLAVRGPDKRLRCPYCNRLLRVKPH